MKRLSLAVVLVLVTFLLSAQNDAKWQRWHYTSEQEWLARGERGLAFVQTPPPTSPRMPGEFEPVEGVLVRHPLGVPYSLIAEISHDTKVFTIVQSNTTAASLKNTYAAQGVDTANCEFVVATTNSYWVRDFGPWFIFDGDGELAIVDFPYDRPRPQDNNFPPKMATYLGVDLYGMNVTQTGGNMMQDGWGAAVSTDLVLDENNNQADTVRARMQRYLGINNYHITIDPLGDYIKHVDCWGKLLAPDKILIARVPATDSRYADYEAVAAYFDTTLCCYGYPYKVYRVDEPGQTDPAKTEVLAPYTNSLIANNKVFVPMGTNPTYNDNAIATYEEAMPGYQIIGIYNSTGSTSWLNTDALHCRTRGVVDRNMMYIRHMPAFDTVEVAESKLEVKADFVAYSGAQLNAGSLLLHYSVNGGEYQTSHFVAADDGYTACMSGIDTGNEVDYYITAADELGNAVSQPIMADLDPHRFVVGNNVLTGLNDAWLSNISLYPNPANAHVIVSTTSALPVEVINAFGQVVDVVYPSSNHVVISTAGYAEGLYFVRTADAKTQKLVVEH